MRLRAIPVVLTLALLLSDPALSLRAGEQAAPDPATLIAANSYGKWLKDYKEATFDVLSDFQYPFPPYGKKLSDRKITPPADVQKLNSQKVSVSGYMLPLDMDAKGVTKFILVRYLDTCCYGLFGDPNEWVVVTMAKKTVFTRYDSITVFGTFHVGEIAHGDGRENIESYYQMDGVAVAVHTEAFDKAAGITQ